MPQIAQQDYIKLNVAPYGFNDMRCMAILAGIYERGQIFDVIIDFGGDDQRKVVSLGTTRITTIDARQKKIDTIFIEDTPTQYQGLAAIQSAEGDFSNVPTLTLIDEYIQDNSKELYVCIEDKFLAATVDENDDIVTLTVSDVECADAHVNISYEDAQKLIGVFAGN